MSFLTPIRTYMRVSKRVFESRISSSREYCSFTGSRALRASSAASASSVCGALLVPNPPPM